MRSFKDSAGRTWKLDINVDSREEVRNFLQLDVCDLLDDQAKGLAEVLREPINLVKILYAFCREQVEAAGLTDKDFRRAFAGDVLEDAAEMFWEELLDFFPNRLARANLKKIISKGKEAAMALMAKDAKKIEAVTPEQMTAEIEKVLDVKLTGSSGSAPASSLSTPDPSLSAS